MLLAYIFKAIHRPIRFLTTLSRIVSITFISQWIMSTFDQTIAATAQSSSIGAHGAQVKSSAMPMESSNTRPEPVQFKRDFRFWLVVLALGICNMLAGIELVGLSISILFEYHEIPIITVCHIHGITPHRSWSRWIRVCLGWFFVYPGCFCFRTFKWGISSSEYSMHNTLR
jgi:hypothetical protein